MTAKILKERSTPTPGYYVSYLTNPRKIDPKLGIGTKKIIENLPIDARGDPYAATDFFIKEGKLISLYTTINTKALIRIFGMDIGGTSLGLCGALSMFGIRTSIPVNLIVSREKITETEKIGLIIKYINDHADALTTGLSIISLNKEDSAIDNEIDRISKYLIETFILYASKGPKINRVGFDLEKLRLHHDMLICGAAIFNVSPVTRGILHINLSQTPILDSTKLLSKYLKSESIDYSIPGAFIIAVAQDEKLSEGIADRTRKLLNEHGIPVIGQLMISSKNFKQNYSIVLYLIDPAFLEGHSILKTLSEVWKNKMSFISQYITTDFIKSMEELEMQVKNIIASKNVEKNVLKKSEQRFASLKNLAKMVVALGIEEVEDEELTKFEYIGKILEQLNKIDQLNSEIKNLKRNARILRIRKVILKIEQKITEAMTLEKEIDDIKKAIEEKEKNVNEIWSSLEKL